MSVHDAVSTHNARVDTTYVHDAMSTHNARSNTREPLITSDAASKHNAMQATMEQLHLHKSLTQEPFFLPCPATPCHQHISGYTMSQVTPAWQHLLTKADLANITRRSCSHSHHQSNETSHLPLNPVVEPPLPVPLNTPISSAMDQESFSLIILCPLLKLLLCLLRQNHR
jgi:hypothetical protein